MIDDDHPTPPSDDEQADILASFMRRMDEIDDLTEREQPDRPEQQKDTRT